MLKDIRELMGDKEAYAAELAKRWGGLLSYRYIGRIHGNMNTGPVDNTVKLRRDMRNAAGGIMAAPLSIAAPESGGVSDMEVVPNPTVYSLQILDDAKDVKRIELTPSERLKHGKQMLYSRCKIIDADNPSRVIALAEGQGASLGVPPEGLPLIDVEELNIEDGPDLPPLWQVFGAKKRADGHWTLKELSEDLASPDGALHIGPQHVALEIAAIEAAAGLVGTDKLQVESYHAMYLARGKKGPFRIDAEPVRGRDDRKVGVRLLLVDEAEKGRSVTSASMMFRIVG